MSSPLTGAAPMADSGAEVIQRRISPSSLLDPTLSPVDRAIFYDIARTAEAINAHGFAKVALQFPDALLPDAGFVYQQLQVLTQAEFFVLADTTYGSCCVDEVAAEHVQAELVVHYGHSCLCAPSRVPVLYVFGQYELDILQCCRAIDESFVSDKQRPIIIMYDVAYHRHAGAVVDYLSTTLGYQHLVLSRISTEHLATTQKTLDNENSSQQPTDACCSTTGSTCGSVPAPHCACTRVQASPHGRWYELLPGTTLHDYAIFYIGTESRALSHIVLTHSQCQIFSFDPMTGKHCEQTPKNNRSLMKRYYLMQKARDADVVGIVVGTLGVAHYLEMLHHLKHIIRQAGKKHYQFVIGKINVAKLANFMEIDVFVLVACPENSLIDSKEFYRPIVTPFELELSLRSELEWTGRYVTDFQQLLADYESQLDAHSSGTSMNAVDEDAPHFSVITGRLKAQRKYRPVALDDDSLASSMRSVTLRNQAQELSTALGSAAGDYMLQRSFRGLEQKLGETAVTKAEQGRRGIARGYTTEKDI
ncbi:Diphthamide biosynthesis protein 2 [Dimargaris verticillata]|uniref:2-(3-amino-3-carboxypropyl)histidine synthase subunit 2 n=1 Tax=Dimargaris verticillata TaxID=2761393 RepID=A0A9W8E6X7_9FUNG|nr:Diphthamide biosynthesis protein 2 [Dimargaris verticillata]